MAMAVGTAPESPPGASAKARGVLGSPTGHPFFNVDGDDTKAQQWHPRSTGPIGPIGEPGWSPCSGRR